MIENRRYSIVSRGEDQPEPLPVVGEDFDLLLAGEGSEERIAHIEPGYVAMLGIYAHVLGLATIGEDREVFSCVAKFIFDAEDPSGEKIGDLTLKIVTGED